MRGWLAEVGGVGCRKFTSGATKSGGWRLTDDNQQRRDQEWRMERPKQELESENFRGNVATTVILHPSKESKTKNEGLTDLCCSIPLLRQSIIFPKLKKNVVIDNPIGRSRWGIYSSRSPKSPMLIKPFSLSRRRDANSVNTNSRFQFIPYS
ncbi:hypothetical protein E5676_scaffold32G00690 [Cucumis melo var. makuwa]|uniref:Uncharacterized protein n=1 Tax=Cucumis melo var. makuwa TaxID=1194695 RepID=A0A5A7TI09_CUCMM|nr:hypothetical protein E6C27_scaffold128G002370 [Cucumis melo var. makuwa]TYK16057.1 hypothetical protein E5676_scaffold32G00690 [Cucumis melo var. makuwa]